MVWFSEMAETWIEYQLEAAEFFQSLRLQAQTDVTIKGVRTTHQIDVLVKVQHAGFEATWIVECKHWQSRVSKAEVLALREIVADVGADRGILLCEAGFQSGAIEAAALTNVQPTSLANLRVTARSQILALQLRELFDRIEVCRLRYWDIPKETRIKYGLRDEAPGYSGARVVELVTEVLTKGFRNVYPFEVEHVLAYVRDNIPRRIDSPDEIVALVEPMIIELENRIAAYDAAVANNWNADLSDFSTSG